VSRRLWALFALFIVYGTTIPFHFSNDAESISAKASAIPWNPLTRQGGTRLSIPDAVQNVMLFVPFGVLGGLACRRRLVSQPLRVAAVTVAGGSLSILVESLQLLTTDRSTAASDVAANSIGAFAGVLVAEQARGLALSVLRAHGSSRWLSGRWIYPALTAIAVLLVAAWQPFDLTLDVSTVGSKVRALLRDPWQAGPWTDEGNAIVLYALATIVLSNWLAACGEAAASAKAITIGAVLAVGLELSQMFVGSRTPAGSDAAVRLLGVAVGAVLIPATRRPCRPLAWVAVLLMACFASAAISNWSPFQVTRQGASFSWFPFLGYYDNNWFPAVSHVIELMLINFPFGFVLAWLRWPRGTTAHAAAIVAIVAIVVEYGQTWFAGRHPDITDAAFSVVGAVVGAWCGGPGAALFEEVRSAVR
jgi:VanZ family protein